MGILKGTVDFFNKLHKNDFVSVMFTKKDGTKRLMKCTLNFKFIPKEFKPKNINVQQILNLLRKNKIIRVYDIESRGWRSIPFGKTEWLETPNKKKYYIKQ